MQGSIRVEMKKSDEPDLNQPKYDVDANMPQVEITLHKSQLTGKVTPLLFVSVLWFKILYVVCGCGWRSVWDSVGGIITRTQTTLSTRVDRCAGWQLHCTATALDLCSRNRHQSLLNHYPISSKKKIIRIPPS